MHFAVLAHFLLEIDNRLKSIRQCGALFVRSWRRADCR